MTRARAILLLAALPALAAVGAGTPRAPIDFTYDVLPILQRQGCASAYCHGAATGQGGFKLSLFGSDPRADWVAITRDLGGRRLDLVAPDASLLLQKPLLRTKHGGGRKLRADGPAHARLRAWIEAGAPFAGDAPRRLLALAAERSGDRVRVTARFADGARDVSGLATLSSSDERVVQVDAEGRVTEVGPGEAWLLARYGGLTVPLRVLRPFGATPGADDATHPLDRAFAARLHELGLAAAPAASPERLARRLWLDLAGRPPTPTELRRFLAEDPATRVEATADLLLASTEFADAFAPRLAAWFEVPAPEDEREFERTRHGHLRQTLRTALREDAPLAELTAKILAPGGEFLERFGDPRDRAEFVGRSLLGLRIGCARCHDHPDDRWRQTEHAAFAACFASPRRGPDGAMMAGVMFDAESGAEVPPRLLPLVPETEADPGADRAVAVHRFVHDARHDLFARNVANRAFAWLLGRGLVEPLDDHRAGNPARHEAWLDTLAAAFHAGGGRLRPLLRTIVTSRLYALDSDGDDDAARWFARREPKPLDGSDLRRAIAAAAGVPATRVPTLPHSPLALRLALLNGEVLGSGTLGAPAGTVDVLATLGGSPTEQLDELFLTCLSRTPRADERAAFLPDLETADDRARALRELAVALLLSREAEFVR